MPARTKTVYVCQQCGARQPKWLGRCPDCNAWNSFVETVERPEPAKGKASVAPIQGFATAVPLTQVSTDGWQRLPLALGEVNRVLGGGVVPGAVMLIGGDPGIGKSTLLLQVCGQVAHDAGPVLYIAAEESAQQVKLRAGRLGIAEDRLLILAETELDLIEQALADTPPILAVIDSIQSVSIGELTSSAGSVSQLRECTHRLVQLAKRLHVPIFLVGHVTKEGMVAGPRVLEHMVDVVLYLEGERFSSFRVLRGQKNRFGSTDELGIFEMGDAGLTEVPDGSALFLGSHDGPAPGAVIAATQEGTRPLLVEVQALAAPTAFGLPRRSATGIDVNRLYMLLAVLTRRAGLPLGNQDVYVNVVGGVRLTEPAADLAVALAVASSLRDQAIPLDLAVAGEVGLSGELRPVRYLERRMAEAERMGFKRLLVPADHRVRTVKQPARSGVQVVRATWLAEAIELALGPAKPHRSTPPSPSVARDDVLDFGVEEEEEIAEV